MEEGRTTQAKNAFDSLSVMAGAVGKYGRETFVKLFLQEHNTLQQQIGSLFLQCLIALAETEYVDARNEAIVKKAKAIKELFGELGYAVPFI